MEDKNDENKNILAGIRDEIIKAMDSPKVELASELSVDLLGVVSPPIGVLTNMAKEISSKYIEYRLQFLLRGLASGENIEKRLNQLYRYVKFSPERAIYAANLFRKTINAESLKVCVIYGLILAKHLEDEKDFTQNELIVCLALESATDYDLNNFKEIMENYLPSKCGGERVVLQKDLAKMEDFIVTCEWCVYNRIFTKTGIVSIDIELYKSNDEPTEYYKGKPAEVLMDYIKEASLVWSYENER